MVGDNVKKLVYFVILGFIIFGGLLYLLANCLVSKKDEGYTRVNVGEVTHSAFYAPLYVSIENGYFKEENLDIELLLISGANNVVAAVLSGDVEIGFCGPEATIYVYKGGEKDYIQTFAGLTKRDGQFIISRNKIDNFTWDMLKGKEVLAGRVGGMPELNFENALKHAKISKKELNINTSVDFASLSSAFISGTGDFVNLFEPNGTKLEQMGFGYIVASVGSMSGEMPYTAFNARKSFIKNNSDIINRFTNAIAKGLKFVKEHDAKTISKIISPQFPDTSINDLVKIVERYKEADSWLDNPYIEETLFKNLEDIIIDSGEIDNYVPYDDLIVNAYKK